VVAKYSFSSLSRCLDQKGVVNWGLIDFYYLIFYFVDYLISQPSDEQKNILNTLKTDRKYFYFNFNKLF
jgi:hypothetical protein